MEKLSSTDVQAINRDSSKVGSVAKPSCLKLLMRMTTTAIILVKAVRILRVFPRRQVIDSQYAKAERYHNSDLVARAGVDVPNQPDNCEEQSSFKQAAYDFQHQPASVLR